MSLFVLLAVAICDTIIIYNNNTSNLHRRRFAAGYRFFNVGSVEIETTVKKRRDWKELITSFRPMQMPEFKRTFRPAVKLVKDAEPARLVKEKKVETLKELIDNRIERVQGDLMSMNEKLDMLTSTANELRRMVKKAQRDLLVMGMYEDMQPETDETVDLVKNCTECHGKGWVIAWHKSGGEPYAKVDCDECGATGEVTLEEPDDICEWEEAASKSGAM